MNNPIKLMLQQQMMSNPQYANNPMAQNIFSMAMNGNIKGVEQFGRNIAKERGVNFDEEFQKFKKQHGVK
jgi:hypothetical protein